jgi:CspA family cold shock protein
MNVKPCSPGERRPAPAKRGAAAVRCGESGRERTRILRIRPLPLTCWRVDLPGFGVHRCRSIERGCLPIRSPFDPPHALRRPFTKSELLLMATGTVKWFNAQKGYGFIQPTTGGNDVFVHISAVERAGMDGLAEGQKVSYELEQGQRGRVSAVNLRPA